MEIVKLAVAVAIMAIAGGLIALFASGYISAFKPGGTNDAATSPPYSGSSGIGGSAVAGVTPSASPPPAPGMPESQQGMPEEQQCPPFLQPTLPAQPAQPLLAPQSPEYPPSLQRPYMPGAQPPSPSMPPVSEAPSQDREPVFSWPPAPVSPYQAGWMQVLSRLIAVLPLLFPGMFPGWTWWS